MLAEGCRFTATRHDYQANVRASFRSPNTRDDFRAARCDRLPATLPRLIAIARATSDSADSS